MPGTWKSAMLGVVFLFSVSVDAPAEDRWQVPSCEKINGTAAVTFTRDDGVTFASPEEPLLPVTYASVAALDTPNQLIASVNSTVLRSTDAGCHWSVVGELTRGASLTALVAAKNGRAYSWAPKVKDASPPLSRIDAAGITSLTTPLTASPNGLGVDAKNSDRLRVAGRTEPFMPQRMLGRLGKRWEWPRLSVKCST